MDWTTGVLLFVIHAALVSTVVAMVWNGPLIKHTLAKEKVRENKEKK
jgi:hypothetical protein